METEFEATFLNINKDEIRERLKRAGAVMIYPEYLMKRVVFKTPVPIKGGWMRVREESDKITMSLKIVDGEKVENQREIQLTIDDFDAGVEFLETIGAKRKSYQETKRELWKLNEVEITIDTWPGLHPFVEIEGEDIKSIKKVSEELGFDYGEAYFGAVDRIYEMELGIRLDVIDNHCPLITFENPPKPYEK